MRGSIKRVEGKRGTSWELVVDGASGADGKRAQIRRRVKGTRVQADAALRKLVEQAEAGTLNAAPPVTLAQGFDQWAGIQAQRIRPNTQATYRDQYAAYIAPRLGNVKIRDLTGPTIQSLLTDLAEHGGRTGSGLSRKSVHHVYRLVSTLCKWAVKSRFIGRNPCDDVEPPRLASPEIQTFDAAQLRKITGFLETHSPWTVPVVSLAVLTGLRRSELLGLQWADLSLDAAMPNLSVRRGVVYLESERRFDTQAPKTARSARAVALSPQAVDVLRARRRQAEADATVTGGPLQPQGWVFAHADGTLPRPGSLTQAFRKACQAVGVKGGHFHGLRHSHASVLIAAGVPLTVVQRRLGHSTITTTANVYAHIAPDLQERAAAAFDGAFKVRPPQPLVGVPPALPEASAS